MLDGIAQYIMFGHVRPLTALLVGSTLMFVPYSAARGLSNRIRSRRSALTDQRTNQRVQTIPDNLDTHGK